MNIYKAINNVMEDIGAIGKDKKSTQGFKYRGIDDVMNALQPALIKHGVFAVPTVLEQTREERATKSGSSLIYSVCKIMYTFYAEDGSSVSATVIGEGMDSGDKSSNKAMAVAFKYACFQVFCIPTDELKDPDAEGHHVQAVQEPVQPVKKYLNTGAPLVASDPQQMIINDDYANAIRKALAEHGIVLQTVLPMYKIQDVSDLTVYKANNLMDHLEDIKKRQDELNGN